MSDVLKKAKMAAETAVGVAKTASISGVVKASPELYTKRLSICEKCPKFSAEETTHRGKILGRRCTVCGCHMKFKAQLQGAKCPEGKW